MHGKRSNLLRGVMHGAPEMLYFIQPRTVIYSLSLRRLLRGGDELNADDVEICFIQQTLRCPHPI
jgi:hypothetical protein